MTASTPSCPFATRLRTVTAIVYLLFGVLPALGQKTTEAVVKVLPAKTAEGQAYSLQYKFKPGEQIRIKVVQLVSSENKIQGTAQLAQSRSISVKRWDVKSVDEQGNITFTHTVEKANMWQHVEGRDEVTYDSEKDKEPHRLYQSVASTIGVPLATVTIRPYGTIKSRKDAKPQFNPGLGDLTAILPPKAVKLEQQWYVPQRLRFKLKSGQYRTIQIRQLFTLKKVTGDIAEIEMKTQVLTPVVEPMVEYQLVQRKQTGMIKFDIRKGRVLSKQLDMDEAVTGFNGPTSRMQYLARFTETLVDSTATGRTAAKTDAKTQKK